CHRRSSGPDCARAAGAARTWGAAPRVLKTIPERRLQIRVQPVLAEEVVRLAANQDAAERRAPVRAACLRVISPRVHARAVLADGSRDPGAPRRANRVRGARDD